MYIQISFSIYVYFLFSFFYYIFLVFIVIVTSTYIYPVPYRSFGTYYIKGPRTTFHLLGWQYGLVAFIG